MFVAMNRFSVNEGREPDFEETWRTRERRLKEVGGFVDFQLLKGDCKEGTRCYISKSNWQDEESFFNWTKSDAFKEAHKTKRMPEGVLQGHPNFEGYSVLLEE